MNNDNFISILFIIAKEVSLIHISLLEKRFCRNSLSIYATLSLEFGFHLLLGKLTFIYDFSFMEKHIVD